MDPLGTDLLVAGCELRETHISRVFLCRDRVYKVKKPVSLGFLDFSTVANRRAACEAEVELNRRLSSDVYLAAVPVTRDAAGRHRFGREDEDDGGDEVVDWAVVMRRLPDDASAEARLRRAELTHEDLDRVALRVARFHRQCRSDAVTAQFGAVACIRANVRENFDQTRTSAPSHVAAGDVREIERYQLALLDARADLFEARARAGYVRDGHGDLRLEHVYFLERGDIAVIDCIEFNERFRYADVCADIAFLSMDLAWHDRADLAEWLLARYARHACDYGLYPLVDFYQSYRAYVRAKVASLLEDDASVSPAAKRRARAAATKYYRLAQASARPPLRRPVVYVVAGMIASGKTTIAEALSKTLCCPVVDADRTRKHLAGVAPDAPLADAPFTGAYTAAASAKVYDTLLTCADQVLASGRTVIVEATFRSRAHRHAVVALAARLGAPLLLVECRVDDETTRQRLRERAQRPSVSDGREVLLEDLRRAWEPVDELQEHQHLVLDTTGPLADNLAMIREAIEAG